MKFVSTFNAVHLNTDPSIAVDGELYFNTASNSYRLYSSGSWVNIATVLDTNPAKVINQIGSPETASVYFTLTKNFINSTIVISSASASNILVPGDNELDVPIGSYVEIIRGHGNGPVDVISGDGNTVEFPSSIFLTSPWDSGTLVKVEENLWSFQAEFRDLY